MLQVYIKPNKVVYLPTTFVEEEFDVARLPLDCELLVEADGELAQETFEVGRGAGLAGRTRGAGEHHLLLLSTA